MPRSPMATNARSAVDNAEQFHIEPVFGAEQVPCQGQCGDLLVLTPVQKGQQDPEKLGSGSLWFCTRSFDDAERQPAVWRRVQFDGYATCQMPPLPTPPQDLPPLNRG